APAGGGWYSPPPAGAGCPAMPPAAAPHSGARIVGDLLLAFISARRGSSPACFRRWCSVVAATLLGVGPGAIAAPLDVVLDFSESKRIVVRARCLTVQSSAGAPSGEFAFATHPIFIGDGPGGSH